MTYMSTGNDTVDFMNTISIVGNVIPHIWYKTITKSEDDKKPYLLAISILSDIVYWYRPREVRDEASGQIVCLKKKFKDDMLQRNYAALSESYGESIKTIQRALARLEELGVIKRVFRTVDTGNAVLGNVMYLDLLPEGLIKLTYPQELEQEILDEKHSDATEEHQVDPMDKNDQRVWTKLTRGYGQNCPDITKNINTKITNTNHINPIEGVPEGMDEIDYYKKLIKENIEYEILKVDMGYQGNLVDEIVELIVEVVSVKRNFIRISGAEYPYQLVQGRFLKLNYEHIKYVMECMSKNSTKVSNIRAYLLTALFNAPSTIDSYYQAEVNHDMYRGIGC